MFTIKKYEHTVCRRRGLSATRTLADPVTQQLSQVQALKNIIPISKLQEKLQINRELKTTVTGNVLQQATLHMAEQV